MKNYFLFFVLVSVLAFSCNKLTVMEDEISFKKYVPFLTLNPADSSGQIYSTNCSETIPFPTDSIESVEVDIDKDGQNDYRFTYATNYMFVSAQDSCENHNSSILVKALGIGNYIFLEDENSEKISVFEKDNKITNANLTGTNAIVFLDHASSNEEITLETGNKYLGVKLAAGGLGWIKVFHDRTNFTFSIIEHAYNRNIHMDIKAGQDE